MSFVFSWPEFSPGFYTDAKEMLVQGLNKGPKPPIIADQIEVEELNMGTQPPELRILSIGDIAGDRFRGIFQLSYSGDAYIVLKTKVQVNPLNHPRPPTVDLLSSPSILFAAAPLVVPMYLRLSNLRISATIVLVVSKQKGITLVFKNDPLQSVSVSSTFDSVAAIQGYIQKEIEGQLREMFRTDLPELIHRLSMKWTSEVTKTPASQVDAQFNTVGPPTSSSPMDNNSRFPWKSQNSESPEHHLKLPHTSAGGPGSDSSFSAPYAEISVPESILGFDPSYGLRPERLPHHGDFYTYRQLLGGSKQGLESVLAKGLEQQQESSRETSIIGEADDSFEVINLKDLVAQENDDVSTWWDGFSSSTTPTPEQASKTFMERIPAVGGGIITRPRIIQSQSRLSSPRDQFFDPDHAASPSASTVARKGSESNITIGRNTGLLHVPSTNMSHAPTHLNRVGSGDGGGDLNSGKNVTSNNNTTSPPSYNFITRSTPRDVFAAGSSDDPTETEVTLNPDQSDSCAHLATLAKSNQTLSPFTRGFEHFVTNGYAPHVIGRTTTGTRRSPLKRKSNHDLPLKARRARKFVLGQQQPVERVTPPDYYDYFAVVK